MIDQLIQYLSYPFVIRALIVSALIALCSSLLGTTLVLKRLSYLGDGLSHVAFSTVAIVGVLKITNQDLFVLPVTIICTVFLLRISKSQKINGDALISMMSVGALAIGYFLLSVSSTSSNLAGDVCTTLFGSTSILTLTNTDVFISIFLSIFVIITFIVFYHKIFSVTFDEEFSIAVGLKLDTYHLFIAIMICTVIVVSMELVGSLLVSALIVFPTLCSIRIRNNFIGVIIASALISVFCAVGGIVSSILLGTPVGSTIVLLNILVFIISCILSKFR